MKNYEIANVNQALGGLMNEKIRGRLKFKLFKNKRLAEDAVKLIAESFEGIEDSEERLEIMDEEQELKIDKFTLDELEPLALSVSDISMLEPIIEFEEEA